MIKGSEQDMSGVSYSHGSVRVGVCRRGWPMGACKPAVDLIRQLFGQTTFMFNYPKGKLYRIVILDLVSNRIRSKKGSAVTTIADLLQLLIRDDIKPLTSYH